MGSSLYFLLLAVVFFTESAFDDKMPGWSCEWEGTAPVCRGGDCSNKNDREITRASEDPKSDLAKFGSDCIFGSKTLCCREAEYVQPPARERRRATRKAKCEWVGDSPTCDSPACPKGQEKMKSSANSTDEGFGSACLSGTKSLCCIV